MPTNVYDGNAAGQEGNYGHASNWSLGAVPVAGDDVVIPASAGPITSGLNQSAVEIKSFTRAVGHAQQIGNGSDDPLILDIAGGAADSLADIGGTGDAWISLGSSPCDVVIRETGNGIGGYGLILVGTALTKIIMHAGNVLLNGVTVTGTVEQRGGVLFCDRYCDFVNAGDFVLSVMLGQCTLECAVDKVRARAGDVVLNGAGAVASLLCDGGTITSNTSGTVTLAQADSGTIDFTQSNVARTVTTMTRSGDGRLKYDPDVITLTNVPTSDGPVEIGKAA